MDPLYRRDGWPEVGDAMIVVWVAALLAGFTIMILASREAIGHVVVLVAGSRIPPFFIGATLLAIGTDLPEIANSIASSVSGHGDVNVGDGVGSAATQATLVLGLLPIIARPLPAPERGVTTTVWLTAMSLVVVAVLLGDGRFGRLDAVVLVVVWLVATQRVHAATGHEVQMELVERPPRRWPLIVKTGVALVVLSVGAVLTLAAIVELADRLDTPELLIGFFAASLGTSLPELVFDVTAIRRGQVSLAIGDLLGSSLVDASLALAVGPLLAPVDVSAEPAVRAALASAVALVLVGVVLDRAPQHDWRTGVIMITLYGAFFLAVP